MSDRKTALVRGVGTKLSAVFFLTAALHAADLGEGKKLYEVQCQACHGEDARGSDRAPELAGSRRLRSRSAAQIQEIIHKGIPEGGMPAFEIPGAQLDALAAFVHSLNSPAAENALPGDAANGEQFFFGAGKCANCHMVPGRS